MRLAENRSPFGGQSSNLGTRLGTVAGRSEREPLAPTRHRSARRHDRSSVVGRRTRPSRRRTHSGRDARVRGRCRRPHTVAPRHSRRSRAPLSHRGIHLQFRRRPRRRAVPEPDAQCVAARERASGRIALAEHRHLSRRAGQRCRARHRPHRGSSLRRGPRERRGRFAGDAAA